MTAGPFCPKCGRPAADATFCPYCGASLAEDVPVANSVPGTPPPPPIAVNVFCPNCGAQVSSDLTFCNRCGTNLLTGAASSHPPVKQGASSNMAVLLGGGAIVVALIVAFLVMSGGGDDESSGGGTSQAAAQPGATRSSSSGAPATAAPRGPAVEPTLDPVPGPPIPPITAQGASLGSTDFVATSEITDSMKKAGINMTGVTIYVLYIRETTDQMLIVNIDGKQATAMASLMNSTADQKKLFTAITSPAIVKERRVTELIINVNDTDPKEGPFSLIIAMPMATAEGFAKGTLTDAQLQQQIQLRTRKG